MPARIISPETAFTASLKVAARAESQGRSTITKTEAEKALKQLDSPQTSQADRARIVKDFLESKTAGALSPKAKEVLVAFVQKNAGGPGTGENATAVKLAAREETSQAERNLSKAQDRLDKLIKSGTPAEKKAGLQQVRAWLDAAEADVMQAKDQLKKIAGNATAKTANKELTQAQKEISKAADDVTRLIASAKGGSVKKADLEAVRAWLNGPLPELQNASNALGFERQTRKFPSDAEDGGAGGGGGITTAKFPSDNEDGGGGGGGVMHTMKAPSDAEDGGGGGGGGNMTTRKFPSDNEDGGIGGGGGGGGMAVTLKFPSDNEDGGGGGGGGGVFHTMKAPSDGEDGGGGALPDPVDNKPKRGEVKAARVTEMKKAFDKLNLAGLMQWNQGGVMESHLGVRFARVELKRDNHPDGYTYTAFIPLGALTPTAPQKDPNKVNEFYVERSGGLAGWTQSFGPIKLT